MVMDAKLVLVWSFMLDYENSANPYPDHREAIAEWKTVAKQHIPALNTILERGANIGNATGIKSKDALHLACALEAGCEYFITTDRAFLSKAQAVRDIKTLNPVDFVMILEDKP
jgi:predicted nucleic acid-binding protein